MWVNQPFFPKKGKMLCKKQPSKDTSSAAFQTFKGKSSLVFEPSQRFPSCALQVIVMSGHETIRVLEVEVDAPPSQKEKATTLQGETETMDRPLPSSEDPQGEDPSWRTVILAERQWNGWKEVDAPVQSPAANVKSEGNATEDLARPTEQPVASGTQVGTPVSQSTGVEGNFAFSSFCGDHPPRCKM